MGSIQKSWQVEQLLARRTYLYNPLLGGEIGSCLADIRKHFNPLDLQSKIFYKDLIIRVAAPIVPAQSPSDPNLISLLNFV